MPTERPLPSSVIKTSAQASAMGRRSVEVRRRDAERRKAAKDVILALRAEPIDEDRLPQTALRACIDVMDRVLAGDIPIRNAGEAAQFIQAAHRVYRLEEDESTSNTAIVRSETTDLSEHKAALQVRLDRLHESG